MPDYSVIDAHIHTYRMAKMGWQAQQGTGRSGYAGTVEEYLDVLAADGIEKAIMVNMTPIAEMREALRSRGMTEDEASAEAIFRRLGVDHILVGSDWPWGHPLRDAQRVRRLPLSEEEKRLILAENARRVLGV